MAENENDLEKGVEGHKEHKRDVDYTDNSSEDDFIEVANISEQPYSSNTKSRDEQHESPSLVQDQSTSSTSDQTKPIHSSSTSIIQESNTSNIVNLTKFSKGEVEHIENKYITTIEKNTSVNTKVAENIYSAESMENEGKVIINISSPTEFVEITDDHIDVDVEDKKNKNDNKEDIDENVDSKNNVVNELKESEQNNKDELSKIKDENFEDDAKKVNENVKEFTLSIKVCIVTNK